MKHRTSFIVDTIIALVLWLSAIWTLTTDHPDRAFFSMFFALMGMMYAFTAGASACKWRFGDDDD